MAQQKYFIKATLDGGASGHDPNFVYHIGHITHPNPDRTSKLACGIGIHLAKSTAVAKKYVHNASEFYVATPGEILGEDNEKIRVADCDILFKVPKEKLRDIDRLLLGLLPPIGNPLCGKEWLELNMFKFTWADFYALKFEFSVDGKRYGTFNTLKKRKDVRTVLKAAMA